MIIQVTVHTGVHGVQVTRSAAVEIADPIMEHLSEHYFHSALSQIQQAAYALLQALKRPE